MAVYALTIFAGAFLLFQVQPLIGKFILPWFGGGPGVWTTCLLFFQVALLGGYAYAHGLTRWLKPRAQTWVHLALLAAAVALLPITPGEAWKPGGEGNPTLQILALLTVALGVPYFVLSSTGPLLQHWFSRSYPGASPYRLYALSNAGSLLALVSYPFYFEAHFTRQTQARLWAGGLILYALGCAWCTLTNRRAQTAANPAGAANPGSRGEPTATATRVPTLFQTLLWLVLPGCATALLLATTNKLCLDVAVVPFLWILPLALYLLSFIISFDSPRWYKRPPFALALAAALAGMCWALDHGSELTIPKQAALYAGGLFICCMVCHGELYRLRPDPARLTGYYLLIAAGGALGGVFVAVGAPLLFTDYAELSWGLMLCGLLFLVVCLRDRDPARLSQWQWMAWTLPVLAFAGIDRLVVRVAGQSKIIPNEYWMSLRAGAWTCLVLTVVFLVARRKARTFQTWRWLACSWLILGLGALGVTLWRHEHDPNSERIYQSRDFYGVLTVFEHRKDDPDEHYFLLQHGRITHGLQFANGERATQPMSYYSPASGLALALEQRSQPNRRLGVVGLGTGTMAAFGRPGDYVRFYEIDPQVMRLASSRFTYLSNCPAQVEVVFGDARLSLEREPPQQFDLLALDAFSSDAIPVHLLTEEAFTVYQRHLKTNGVLAVHVSNHFLDLEPVVQNLACRFNYKVVAIDYDETDDEWWFYSSTWMLLTRDEGVFDSPAIAAVSRQVSTNAPKVPLWTDDFASVFQILK